MGGEFDPAYLTPSGPRTPLTRRTEVVINLHTDNGSSSSHFYCNSPGRAGSWDEPRDHCWDSQGRLIICDYGNNRVLRNIPDYEERYNWEIILPADKIPGLKPACVTIADDKYLYLVSSEDEAPILSCYKYNTDRKIPQQVARTRIE